MKIHTSMVSMKSATRPLILSNSSSFSTVCKFLLMRLMALWHIESHNSSTWVIFSNVYLDQKNLLTSD